MPLAEIVAELEDLSGRLERLERESPLPPDPDRKAVDRFLVEAYEAHWRLGSS